MGTPEACALATWTQRQYCEGQGHPILKRVISFFFKGPSSECVRRGGPCCLSHYSGKAATAPPQSRRPSRWGLAPRLQFAAPATGYRLCLRTPSREITQRGGTTEPTVAYWTDTNYFGSSRQNKRGALVTCCVVPDPVAVGQHAESPNTSDGDPEHNPLIFLATTATTPPRHPLGRLAGAVS